MPYWPVENGSSDPFGVPIFKPLSTLEATDIICEAGKRGLIELTSAHDDDLVKWDPDSPEDDQDITSETYKTLLAVRDRLQLAGLGFHTMTCNLHTNPIFKNGGLTNPDPKIRELAKLKVRRAIRIGAFLGARKFTYWTARDGWIVGVKTQFDQAYAWLREGLNDARDYIEAKGFVCYHGCTIEPKPNEPTGHSFLQTAGHAVGFIATLKDPSFWGVNPELPQHEGMTLLDAPTCVAYLLACGKLSFLHFGSQIKGHEDNDYPPLVGPEGLKEVATMFWIMEQAGWKGVVEYDCHMLRSEADPANQAESILKFIENCSTGLAIALLLATSLNRFSRTKANEALGQSEADLMATAAMCGIAPEGVELYRQAPKM